MGGQQHDGCFFGEGRKDAAAAAVGGTVFSAEEAAKSASLAHFV